MHKKIIFSAILFGLLVNCLGQQNSRWNNWSWLIGEWKGERSGKSGQGGGTFTFKNDLDQRILVRKSHSEYPATGNEPRIIHDDLMVIYPDLSGNPVKAIYFDNEGHTINYSIVYLDRSIVLTSDKIPNIPVFRLTYSHLKDDTVDTKFEISRDDVKFNTYIEGRSIRIK